MRLTFIADDYGESLVTNMAIVAACTTGMIRSATVLAAEECVYENEHLSGSHDISWGAHLYLTEYAPLTDAVRKYYLQRPALSKRNLLAGLLTGRLSPRDLFFEFETQLVRLQEMGFSVRFIDTHQNIHGIPTIYCIVKAVAEKYRLSNAIRPIYQLDFCLKRNLRQLMSGLCSIYLGLATNKRVLVKAPCYCASELDLNITLEAWDVFLYRVKRLGIIDLYIPCHPGISPAEMELYSSTEFSRLMHRRAIQIV
jgi:predicted glycoside hydrolase/deacetylase ChbG (UPF0249 family)